MDKLTSMQVFVRVAKSGSFAVASDEMGISRAMATKHIKHLENKLGVRLLNRTTRRLSITEVGNAYLERCLEILDQVEETEVAITQLQTEPRGTVKISAPPFFGTYHLTPAISDYIEIYPDVNFEIVLKAGAPDLIEEGLDVAIRLDPLPDSSLIARKLADSALVVCASPGYLDKIGRPETPNELERHNCLVNWSLPPYDIWNFKQQSDESSIKVSGTIQASVAGAVRLAALNGSGLVNLPTYMVGKDLQREDLEAVLTDYEPSSLDIHAVYPHRKHLSAKVRTFVDFFYQRLQPAPYWDNWKNGTF